MKKRLGLGAALAAMLLVVSAVLGACSGSDDGMAASAVEDRGDAAGSTGGSSGSGEGQLQMGSRGADSAAVEAEALASETTSDVSLDPSGLRAQAPLPDPQQRVIKTADLQIEVPDGDFREAMQRGRAVATRFGGFVLATSVDGKGASTGTFVMRVPSQRFEEALSALEDLGKVTREQVAGEDVGEEFVDLEARLRNLTAQEQVLLRLYDEAVTIADTIRIQREVEDVQLEIEQIRGRLRYLRDQTALGTIQVSVVEAGAVVTPKGTLGKAWQRAQEVFLGVISAAIVGAGFVFPIALFAALLYFAVRVALPRLARHQI